MNSLYAISDAAKKFYAGEIKLFLKISLVRFAEKKSVTRRYKITTRHR